MGSDQLFEVGCRVRSPFGDGTVTRVGDLKVLIRLDAAPQLPLTYSKEKLVVIQPAPSGARDPQAKAAVAELPRTAASASASQVVAEPPSSHKPDPDSLKAIEALRFGLVPTARLPHLTLGFDKARQWVLERLPASGGDRVVSQVNGPFGTGKSHMMALIRYLAMREGYAVAHVEVDGSCVSLSQPAALLARLWQSVSAETLPSTYPLLSLYLKAVQSGLRGWQLSRTGLERTKGNLDMVRFLHENHELDAFEEAIDAFIGGSPQYTASQLMREIRQQSRFYLPTQLHSVIGRDLEGRANDFIDSLVSNTLVAVHAGYKGLVVTIDEFEVEYNLPWQYLDRTKQLVEALHQYMSGGSWPKAPLGLFFAAVGQDGHQGDEIIEKLMSRADGDCYWELKPWPKSARNALAEKLYDLYAATYGIREFFEDAWFDDTEDACRGEVQNIRSFIKRFIARLDEEFGPPAW